jgi:hypothetical protein
VRRLCNHAMLAWRQLHATDPRRFGTPLALELTFPWGRSAFWGGRNVYRWFRGTLGPAPVEAALMAMEDWAFAEIDRGRPVDDVIRQVVSGNECCAVLGIAAALALSRLQVSPAVVPLITCQHLWHWDLQRAIEDRSGLHANMMGGAFLRRDPRLIEATDRANKRPVRRYEIRHLVTPSVLSSDHEIARAVQGAIQSFPKHLPYSLAEEVRDATHVQKLTRTAEIWAEMGRPETYIAAQAGDGKGTLIYHQSPKATDSDVTAAAARAAEMNADAAILNWVHASFDKGQLDSALSIDQAIAQARSLDRPELFSTPEKAGGAELFRTAAISGAAAAALTFARDLTVQQRNWAIDIVQRASRMPSPEDEYGVEYSANSHHPCRYAARGLGALVQEDPSNGAAKEMLLRLAGHLVYMTSRKKPSRLRSDVGAPMRILLGSLWISVCTWPSGLRQGAARLTNGEERGVGIEKVRSKRP